MYCSTCGSKNADGAQICSSCGRQLPRPSPLQYAGDGRNSLEYTSNYLWQSIVCTLFCCQPLGIVAIVFAAQASTKLAQGQLLQGQQAAESARNWCIASLVVGLCVWGLVCAGGVLGG